MGGGCTLTSLTNFSERQEKTALTKMSSEKVKGMDFYKDMFRRWYWMKSLEKQIEEKKDSKFQTTAVLEMAGVSSVVCGQEMPRKPDLQYISAETYKYRATTPYEYGFHDPYESMDSCF